MGKSWEYLNAGAVGVWILPPKLRQVLVIRSDGATHLLRAADELTEPTLLSGFTVRVKDLFDDRRA